MVASGAQITADDQKHTGTVSVINAAGPRQVVLVCEHASNHIPPQFADLGLDEAALQSHIAWDPGARGISGHLSTLLDAPLVCQNVSRLVYDCNRPPEAEAAMPAVSEVYAVPGNQGLSKVERDLRTLTYYVPFADSLSALIERRIVEGRPPALVTIHTFNPTYAGVVRNYDIGILHDEDSRLADALLDRLQRQSRFDVRRNMPYGPQDGVTHTLKVHALPHGLPNVMIEIRNDRVPTRESEQQMAEWLAPWLEAALEDVSANAKSGAGHA